MPTDESSQQKSSRGGGREGYPALQAVATMHETRLSWLRLVCFVGIAAVWLLLWRQYWLAAGLTVPGIGLFAWAVAKHQQARDRREQADRLVIMAEESARRTEGAAVAIRSGLRPVAAPQTDGALPHLFDEGPAWEITDQERDDLDLYAGPVGIFGLLNRTSTQLGARRLCEMLDRPLLTVPPIVERQDAVEWLAERTDARDEVMAATASLRDEDARLTKLIAAVRGCRPLRVFAPVKVLALWSVLTTLAIAASLVLALMGMVQWGGAAGLIFAINLALYFRMRAALGEAIAPWVDVAWAVRGLEVSVRHAAQRLPEAGQLGRLREIFAGVAGPRLLSRLLGLVGWAERGGSVHFVFNVVAFYDLHVAARLCQTVAPQRDALLAACAALARLEALCTLACFAAEQPIRCRPTWTSDRKLLISGGVHPLLPAAGAVPNDVRLDAEQRIWIITGSNMAGKSTLLRMSGVSVLLAQVGGTPTAHAMQLCPLRLISDLRARDSLAARESYYLSEVRHLRRMIDPEVDGGAVLGLIDEPFRGTNSMDQSAASVAVLRHLLCRGHFFLLATHDRHLTTLADGRAAINLHFRENLGDEGLVFDYRLHDGPATTRNALRILEREGYPQGLLADATDWLRHHDAAP